MEQQQPPQQQPPPQQPPPQQSSAPQVNVIQKPDTQFHKLFVGQLPRTMNEDTLIEMFKPYTSVQDINILRDHTGSSKGCGFVTLTSREDAIRAIADLNEQREFEHNGLHLVLKVRFADTPAEKARKQRARMDQGGGGYGAGPAAYAPPPGYQSYGGGYGAQQYQQPYGAPPAYAAPAYGGGYGAPAAAGGYHAGGQATYPGNNPRQVPGPPGANLFIFSIPSPWRDAELAATFAPFGTLVSARVMMDNATGQSKGYGFVSFSDPANAQRAIQAMDGFDLGNGTRMQVSLKKGEPGAPPSGPSGGGRY